VGGAGVDIDSLREPVAFEFTDESQSGALSEDIRRDSRGAVAHDQGI
jgi:hypothetical protein